MTRSAQLTLWFSTEAGQRLLAVQQAALSTMLSRCFGCYALQVSPIPLAMSAFPAIAKCYFLIEKCQAPSTLQLPFNNICDAIMVDMQTLPFESASINAILLHHTLDVYEHPHQFLREVDRVLVPGGRLILVGFNPWSLWGGAGRALQMASPWLPLSWRQICSRHLPWNMRYLTAMRLKDWLQLLNFEVDDHQILMLNSCFMAWPFNRFFRQLGAVYVLSGVKRSSCLTPIRPRWSVPANRFSGVSLPLTPATQISSTLS